MTPPSKSKAKKPSQTSRSSRSPLFHRVRRDEGRSFERHASSSNRHGSRSVTTAVTIFVTQIRPASSPYKSLETRGKFRDLVPCDGSDGQAAYLFEEGR